MKYTASLKPTGACFHGPKDFPPSYQPPLPYLHRFPLGANPDCWRNTTDLALKHVNGPNHYIDIEELLLYGLTP